MRVLLHCCLAERSWNPYYAALAVRLAQHSKAHRLTLQYALWDRIQGGTKGKVSVRGGSAAACMWPAGSIDRGGERRGWVEAGDCRGWVEARLHALSPHPSSRHSSDPALGDRWCLG